MYERYPDEDSSFARIEFVADVSLRLCIFSSKASSRASRRSAFCVFDVPFERFKAVLAIPIRSFIPRSLLSWLRGNWTLKENCMPRSLVERLFLLGTCDSTDSAIA